MGDIPRLHVVTPPTIDAPVLAACRAALDSGADLIQVRTKSGTDRDRLADVRAVAGLAPSRLVVNDRIDLAAAVGAGVHLGDEDLPVEVARSVLGGSALVGATARTTEEARRAEAAGASYLGVGPAYATQTKTVGIPPIGPSGVGRVARAVGIPVIAIAGVTVDRVPELLDAGAWGVAVIGAIFGAPNPGAATAELLGALT